MYKLIKATPEHAPQILPYLNTTCYWKEFTEGNLLGLDHDTFMLEWFVKPRVPFTTVLVKEGDEHTVLGCIITGSTEDLALMPDYTPHLHPRVLEVFKPWFEFVMTDGVIVELYATSIQLRGQGHGGRLFQVAQELAATTATGCISGFIWNFFPDSLRLATKKGCLVTHCINFPEPLLTTLLYVQKKPEYQITIDYFQTEAYKNANNMLLTQ